MNPEALSGATLDTFFDQDLLCVQAGDAIELSEKTLSATGVIVKDIGCAMPASEKGYVYLVRKLAGDLKGARQKSVADLCGLLEQDGKIEELRLKVQFLADYSKTLARLQVQMSAENVRLTAALVAAS